LGQSSAEAIYEVVRTTGLLAQIVNVVVCMQALYAQVVDFVVLTPQPLVQGVVVPSEIAYRTVRL
jgi:hypothetical protein